MSKPSKTIHKAGCGLLVGCLAVFGIVVGIIYASCSNFFGNLMGEETFEISGDNRRFDAFAKLEEIKGRLQPNARLVSIKATFVRSDGTMDLEAKYTPFPQTEYIFHRPLEKPPENAPPLGAGRGPNDIWYEEIRVQCFQPGQYRHVTKSSGNSRTTYTYKHLGIDIDRGTPRSGQLEPALPDPQCTLQKLWEIAIEKGADRNAVARVEYDKQGYQFRIDRTDVRFACDADCRVKD